MSDAPAPEEQRYRPEDGCPLFSERLEEHLVAVQKGHEPNRGVFCGHCYTPIGRETARCPHCDTATRDRTPVTAVPKPIALALYTQRKIEARWVNGFAYLGVLISVLGGLGVVLSVPFLRDSLIWATVVYGTILLLGSRGLAGFLGGYYGDRLGFERARAQTIAAWEAWLSVRDTPAADHPAEVPARTKPAKRSRR